MPTLITPNCLKLNITLKNKRKTITEFVQTL